MLGRFTRRALLALAAVTLVAGTSIAGEIYSTMRNVNAVPEAHGFSLSPVFDVDVPRQAGDLAPPQAFEILRADDKPVTIGRLFTSCTCIQLEAHKRTFRPGERAILQLRNIRPTPQNGQIYAIFVQITHPIRATLRFDTFVQTGMPEITATGTMPDPTADVASDPNAPTPIPVPTDDQRQSAVVIINEEPPTPPSQAGTAAFLDDTASTDSAAAPEQASENTGATDNAGATLADLPAMTEAPAAQVSRAEAALEAAQDGVDVVVGQVRVAAEAVRAGIESLAERALGSSSDAQADFPRDGLDDLPDFNAAVPAPEPVPAVPPSDLIPTVNAPLVVNIPTPVPTEYDLPPFSPSPSSGMDSALAGQPIPRPERDPNARRPVQAVSLITIGVRDMPASIRFYEALGWQRAARGKYDQTAFFQLQGQILALYPIQDQLREQNMAGAIPAPGGITLALHVSDKADVWAVYQRFIDAGGTSLRPPAEMASGAVSSYVADPDGNPWEISWVPQFRIDAEGGLWLP